MAKPRRVGRLVAFRIRHRRGASGQLRRGYGNGNHNMADPRLRAKLDGVVQPAVAIDIKSF